MHTLTTIATGIAAPNTEVKTYPLTQAQRALIDQTCREADAMLARHQLVLNTVLAGHDVIDGNIREITAAGITVEVPVKPDPPEAA